MTHAQIGRKSCPLASPLTAVEWCSQNRPDTSGEMPDAHAGSCACHSVLVECKVTRPPIFSPTAPALVVKAEQGVGSDSLLSDPRRSIRPKSD